ncbi:SET domain-containing protein [Poronia punctata]|nr:SET domain-containing protein [Poronia punctata]
MQKKKKSTMSTTTPPDGLLLSGTTTSSPQGRSIIASRTFGPGERIATFSEPSIAIPDSPHLSTTCSGCLLPATATSSSVVRECTGCRTVAYCSPACQKLDWTVGGHKAECKVLKRVRDEDKGGVLPTPVRALVKVLINKPGLVDGLEGHVDLFRGGGGGGKGKVWEDMELQAMAGVYYMGKEKSARVVMEAVEVLCKLQVNSFNRLDEDVDQTGLFLNPVLAMVNHSCVPNAFVQFVGRTAVLHAFQEIKEGEEIRISYIDCNTPLSTRQQALKTQYHFTCSCPRCSEDLDVYQVSRRYPHLDLNNLSLAPEIQLPITGMNPLDKGVRSTAEETYSWCSKPIPLIRNNDDKQTQLCQRWKAIKPLRDSKVPAYAIEPMPSILTEASIYFAERDEFAFSLVIACFLATKVDCFKFPAPFAPHRVKGLLMIAKLLANVAADSTITNTTSTSTTSTKNTKGKEKTKEKIIQILRETDHPTICQVLLELVVRYAYSKDEWKVAREAKDLLDDLEEILPGREKSDMLVIAFLRNPDGKEERRFFEMAVLKIVRDLAGLLGEVMDGEFGGL